MEERRACQRCLPSLPAPPLDSAAAAPSPNCRRGQNRRPPRGRRRESVQTPRPIGAECLRLSPRLRRPRSFHTRVKPGDPGRHPMERRRRSRHRRRTCFQTHFWPAESSLSAGTKCGGPSVSISLGALSASRAPHNRRWTTRCAHHGARPRPAADLVDDLGEGESRNGHQTRRAAIQLRTRRHR